MALVIALLSVLPSLSSINMWTQPTIFPHYTHLTFDVPLLIRDAACLGWIFWFLDCMFFISAYSIAKITHLTNIFVLAFFFQGLSSSYFPDYYSRTHLTSVTFIYYYFTMAVGQVHLLTYSFEIICSLLLL
jgi:hypothetical protein